MKKRQNRKCLSFKPEVHETLRRAVPQIAGAISMTNYVEFLIRLDLQRRGIPVLTREEVLAERRDQRQHAAVVRLGLTPAIQDVVCTPGSGPSGGSGSVCVDLHDGRGMRPLGQAP
jgi:hypothetical protein